MKMLEELTPLNRVMCSSDYDRTISYLAAEAPFRILSFGPGVEHNGWVIPPKWDVTEALILKDGSIVYDGLAHSLGVIALSAPYSGTVGRDELRRHLHYDHRYDDSLPFHFRQQFRSWQRDWGFCVPRRLYDELPEGDYSVSIRASEQPGYLSMLEWTLPGRTKECIVLNANLDHPGVSNDGLSGVVVGIEFFRRLSRRPRRFTYKLVLNQGIIGPEYYLGLMSRAERALIRETICLWMLGSRTQIALQQSRGARSLSERFLAEALEDLGVNHRQGAFGTIMINDEYVWEAYGIPTTSLNRFPYPEYHSSRDNIGIIGSERLEEAVAVLERATQRLDDATLVERSFEGTICLSNPRFNLYVDPGQIAFGDIPSEERRRLRYLQDLVSSLTKPVSLAQLALESGLQEDVTRAYLEKWQEKGLIRLY